MKNSSDMKTTHEYASAAEALNALAKQGYSVDYNVEFDYLLNHAEDYHIDYLYRYEGESDPSDENSVYGIRNTVTEQKGVFVTGNLAFLEGKKRKIILDLERRAKKGDA